MKTESKLLEFPMLAQDFLSIHLPPDETCKQGSKASGWPTGPSGEYDAQNYELRGGYCPDDMAYCEP